MSEVVGMMMIWSAIIIGCTFLFGFDMSFKEKIQSIIGFELFIFLIVLGSYILAN